MPNNQELLSKLQELLHQNGVDYKWDAGQPSKQQLIEALHQLARTHSLLSSWEPTQSSGLGAKLKFKIVSKIKAVIVNTLNPALRKQEQFNLLMVAALSALLDDHDRQ